MGEVRLRLLELLFGEKTRSRERRRRDGRSRVEDVDGRSRYDQGGGMGRREGARRGRRGTRQRRRRECYRGLGRGSW